MASEVHAIVFGDTRLVGAAAQLIDRRLARLERSWSRFVASSDVSRLNAGSGQWVEVDADTIALLDVMRVAAQRTGGLYDPTVLPALVAAGYTRSAVDGSAAPAVPGDPIAGPAPGVVAFEIDVMAGHARIAPGAAVDPGGLGKGLAADLVAGDLLRSGAAAALVGVGGDLRTVGAPPGGSWSIRVEHPDDPATAVTAFDLDDGGVATSTTRTRRRLVDRRWTHDVIDPRTGCPAATDLMSATVIAPTAWQAEAFATAALVAGAAGAYALLCESGMPGILVNAAGVRLLTPDLVDSEPGIAR